MTALSLPLYARKALAVAKISEKIMFRAFSAKTTFSTTASEQLDVLRQRQLHEANKIHSAQYQV